MNYQSYKGRSIDFTKQVKIYKNLHNGLFSVMQDNLVVAHIENFKMSSVIFKVNESGRQRVIQEKKKNVHAFICRLLQEINCTDDDLIISNPYTKIRYNPYVSDSFMLSINSFKINNAAKVYGCVKNGMVQL